jgi:predicted membrane-bound dolichyl-phosphate-mannose-protein mannosyltransferase
MLCLQVLEQLVSKLLAQMPLLLRMLDNIALLDMLLSFFQAVTGRSAAAEILLCRLCSHA